MLFFGLCGAVVLLGLGPLLVLLWLAGVSLGSLTWQSFGTVRSGLAARWQLSTA